MTVFFAWLEDSISKGPKHAPNETKKQPVDALVFVGDCVEEDVDALGAVAGELGILGVPYLFSRGLTASLSSHSSKLRNFPTVLIVG